MPSDTGQAQLLINLPRLGNWTVIDDIYLTDFAADQAGNTGQLGVVNIVPDMPASDSQSQFTNTGSASTHAAQVAGALSLSQGSVASYTVGGKDIYNTNPNIPANYRVQAVQVEGFFSKYGSSGAAATVGIVSNGVEADSGQVAAMTANPVFGSFIQALDPKTNQPWTIAGVTAAKIAITKVT